MGKVIPFQRRTTTPTPARNSDPCANGCYKTRETGTWRCVRCGR